MNRYEKSEKTHILYFQDQEGEISSIELSNSRAEGLPSSQFDQIFDSRDLRFRNGFYYILDSKTPVTGKVVKKYPGPKETRWYERSYKDGKKHGKTTEWFVNGQKKYEMF